MRQLFVVCGLWFVVIACTALQAPRPTNHKPHTVTVSGFRFSPAELAVSVGDSVVWTNSDALLHTTAADSGAWSSPEMRQGDRFTFVASSVGRFPYHCAAHPVMRATIVVRQ